MDTRTREKRHRVAVCLNSWRKNHNWQKTAQETKYTIRQVQKALTSSNSYLESIYRKKHYKTANIKRTFLHWGNKNNTCEACQHAMPLQILEFHHRNPFEKNFQIGQYADPKSNIKKNKNKNKIINELSKCDVLCGNCHQKEHINSNKLNDLILHIRIRARLNNTAKLLSSSPSIVVS